MNTLEIVGWAVVGIVVIPILVVTLLLLIVSIYFHIMEVIDDPKKVLSGVKKGFEDRPNQVWMVILVVISLGMIMVDFGKKARLENTKPDIYIIGDIELEPAPKGLIIRGAGAGGATIPWRVLREQEHEAQDRGW